MTFALLDLCPYLREKCVEKMKPNVYNKLIRTNQSFHEHISNRKHRYYGPMDFDIKALFVSKEGSEIEFYLKHFNRKRKKVHPTLFVNFMKGFVVEKVEISTIEILEQNGDILKTIQYARAINIARGLSANVLDSLRPRFQAMFSISNQRDLVDLLAVEYTGHFMSLSAEPMRSFDETIIGIISKFEVFGIYISVNAVNLVQTIFKEWGKRNFGINNRIVVSISGLDRDRSLELVLGKNNYVLTNIGEYFTRDYKNRRKISRNLFTFYLLERQSPASLALVGWGGEYPTATDFTYLIFYQIPEIEALAFIVKTRLWIPRCRIKHILGFAENCSIGHVPKWTQKTVRQMWI